MAFDEVLAHLGEFGRYQKRIYLLLCLPAISCALHKLAFVFLGAKASHRCLMPFEDPSNATYAMSPNILNMSLPWDDKSGNWSQCFRLDANFTDEYFQSGEPASSMVPCTDWVYDHSKYMSSAVFEVRIAQAIAVLSIFSCV